MIGLALLLASGPFLTADGLSGFCRSDASSLQSVCLGYIGAVNDILRERTVLDRPTFCPGPTVSLAQERDVVLAYIRTNPDAAQHSGVLIAGAALERAYPCPKD